MTPHILTGASAPDIARYSSPIVRCLGSLYGRIAARRRAWYARHPEARRRLARPVISVGNLVVGGSGKTPTVAALVQVLLAMGERSCDRTEFLGKTDFSCDGAGFVE